MIKYRGWFLKEIEAGYPAILDYPVVVTRSRAVLEDMLRREDPAENEICPCQIIISGEGLLHIKNTWLAKALIKMGVI